MGVFGMAQPRSRSSRLCYSVMIDVKEGDSVECTGKLLAFPLESLLGRVVMRWENLDGKGPLMKTRLLARVEIKLLELF